MQRGHIGGRLLGEAYGQEFRQVTGVRTLAINPDALQRLHRTNKCQIVQVSL